MATAIILGNTDVEHFYHQSFIKQHLATEPLNEVGLFPSEENTAVINPERSSDFQCFSSSFWIFKKYLHVMYLLLNITILIPTGKELKNKRVLGRTIPIVSSPPWDFLMPCHLFDIWISWVTCRMRDLCLHMPSDKKFNIFLGSICPETALKVNQVYLPYAFWG